MFFSTLKSAALLAALPLTYAQTFTDCNPLSKTCPANKGLAQASYTTDFSSGFSNWSPSSSAITSGGNGAQFAITADGQAPTLQSDFYIFFGRVDVTMKAAPGVGIVSAIVLESDDLDEIDWEFLGGDTTQGQSNFFGKGDTTSYARGAYHPVSAPQNTFHTYSIDWSESRIQWLIDGNVVRELPYSSPLAEGGNKYPQTPAKLKIGNWVAGGANNPPGTVEWAGGKTDFSQAPFVMTVKSVSVTNANPAASYTYGDNSGSYKSIQKSGAVAGGSPPVSSAPVVISTTAVKPTTTAQSAISSSISLVLVPNKPVSEAASSVISVATSSAITTSAVVTVSVSSASTAAVTSAPASSGFSSSTRVSSSASATSSGPVRQTGNSAASVDISAIGSVLSLAAVFFLF